MVEVRKSFAAITFLAIALGFVEEFILFFIAVTLHELSHIAAAKYFKLTFIKIIFTPIGEIAVINGIENLRVLQRCSIFVAGPLANIILWLITKSFFPEFAQINLYICLFNMLPIYPLDGGGVLQTVAGSAIGVLNATLLLNLFSKTMSVLMITAGIVQVILYPYNVTLLCIGVYLLKNINKEYFNSVCDMYKILLKGYGRIKERGYLHSKTVYVSANLTLLKFIRSISFDHFFIIHITDGNNIVKTVDESYIAEHVLKNGISGTFGDICADGENMITKGLKDDKISNKHIKGEPYENHR